MANSPLPGADPLKIPKPPKIEQLVTDWEKLGKSGAYPEINTYFEEKKEYLRHYLPNGKLVSKVSSEEAAKEWPRNSWMIQQIEYIQSIIAHHLAESEKRKSK